MSANDPTMNLMASLDDPDRWVCVPGMPVFTPHVRHDDEGNVEALVDLPELQLIADTVNGMIARHGRPVRISCGHVKLHQPGESPPPEHEQPPIWGWAVNARVGTWGPESEPGLLFDHYYRADKWADEDAGVLSYPYRSAEYYPETHEITGIALLRRDPELDLGVHTYARATAASRPRAKAKRQPVRYADDPDDLLTDEEFEATLEAEPRPVPRQPVRDLPARRERSSSGAHGSTYDENDDEQESGESDLLKAADAPSRVPAGRVRADGRGTGGRGAERELVRRMRAGERDREYIEGDDQDQDARADQPEQYADEEPQEEKYPPPRRGTVPVGMGWDAWSRAAGGPERDAEFDDDPDNNDSDFDDDLPEEYAADEEPEEEEEPEDESVVDWHDIVHDDDPDGMREFSEAFHQRWEDDYRKSRGGALAYGDGSDDEPQPEEDELVDFTDAYPDEVGELWGDDLIAQGMSPEEVDERFEVHLDNYIDGGPMPEHYADESEDEEPEGGDVWDGYDPPFTAAERAQNNKDIADWDVAPTHWSEEGEVAGDETWLRYDGEAVLAAGFGGTYLPGPVQQRRRRHWRDEDDQEQYAADDEPDADGVGGMGEHWLLNVDPETGELEVDPDPDGADDDDFMESTYSPVESKKELDDFYKRSSGGIDLGRHTYAAEPEDEADLPEYDEAGETPDYGSLTGPDGVAYPQSKKWHDRVAKANNRYNSRMGTDEPMFGVEYPDDWDAEQYGFLDGKEQPAEDDIPDHGLSPHLRMVLDGTMPYVLPRRQPEESDERRERRRPPAGANRGDDPHAPAQYAASGDYEGDEDPASEGAFDDFGLDPEVDRRTRDFVPPLGRRSRSSSGASGSVYDTTAREDDNGSSDIRNSHFRGGNAAASAEYMERLEAGEQPEYVTEDEDAAQYAAEDDISDDELDEEYAAALALEQQLEDEDEDDIDRRYRTTRSSDIRDDKNGKEYGRRGRQEQYDDEDEDEYTPEPGSAEDIVERRNAQREREERDYPAAEDARRGLDADGRPYRKGTFVRDKNRKLQTYAKDQPRRDDDHKRSDEQKRRDAENKRRQGHGQQDRSPPPSPDKNGKSPGKNGKPRQYADDDELEFDSDDDVAFGDYDDAEDTAGDVLLRGDIELETLYDENQHDVATHVHGFDNGPSGTIGFRLRDPTGPDGKPADVGTYENAAAWWEANEVPRRAAGSQQYAENDEEPDGFVPDALGGFGLDEYGPVDDVPSLDGNDDLERQQRGVDDYHKRLAGGVELPGFFGYAEDDDYLDDDLSEGDSIFDETGEDDPNATDVRPVPLPRDKNGREYDPTWNDHAQQYAADDHLTDEEFEAQEALEDEEVGRPGYRPVDFLNPGSSKKYRDETERQLREPGGPWENRDNSPAKR